MSSTSFGGKSVVWVVADTVSTSLLSIGTMLVLARLAGPSDFGAAALILGMTLLVNLYVEGLFHDALIQNRNLKDGAFDQALTLVLLIAAGIIAVTLVGALLASGTAYARFGWYALASSSLLAFSGPLGIANARLRRAMKFKDVARASVLGRVFGCLVAILVAWCWSGLGGLIAQNTAAAMAQVVILYATGSWRPRLRLSFDALGPLLRFALPYAFMHTIVAARIQGFAMIVASLMGLSAAGFINVAFRLTTTPQVALLTTFTNLCFPLLAQHQASRPDRERAFVLSTKLISTAAFPTFVGLALVADDLVPVILGPGWTSSILLMQLVAIGAAVAFGRTACSLVLRALGHVRYSFLNATFQLVTTLGGLALLRPTDPVIAVALWILPIILQVPVSWIVTRRVAGIGFAQQMKGLLPPLVATLAMAAAVTLVRAEAAGLSGIGRLALSVVAGAVVYCGAVLLFDDEARALLRRRKIVPA